MTTDIVIWIGIGAVVIAIVGSIVWYRRRDRAPSGPSMEIEELARQLETFGLDLDSSRIPDLDVATPYLAPDTSIVAAARAKNGAKRALLLLLDDRLVVVESTIAAYGARVRNVPLEAIEAFEQSYDIGGEFEFHVEGESLFYTHVPRSQTSDFADAVREAL